jgi:hypothetical protein
MKLFSTSDETLSVVDIKLLHKNVTFIKYYRRYYFYHPLHSTTLIFFCIEGDDKIKMMLFYSQVYKVYAILHRITLLHRILMDVYLERSLT